MARSWFVLVLLAACGGSKPSTTSSPEAQPPVAVPVRSVVLAPQVTEPGAVSRDDGPPPVVVLVDAQGKRRLAAARSWGEVGAGAWSAGPKAADGEASRRAIRESAMLGRAPKETVEGFVDYRVDADRRSGAEDDPPPPEEADESGGTGTAMALEEGKMGRKPSAASVGPWRGRRFGMDARYTQVIGEVSDAKLEHVPAVIVADPAVRATVVVEAVSELEAMIGVWSGGQLRPLRIQFHQDRDHTRELDSAWVELELGKSVTLDRKPVELAALKPALAARPKATVDLLVGPELDAQRLVDALVALERAGVTSIGLGRAPTEAEREANRPPVMALGQLSAMGDLDKASIRDAVRKQLPKITYCYEKELLSTPNLEGTLIVQFFITPSGSVATASGSGVNPAVAACVANVVKGIQFPKPKGGGGVQVNYPFTFRPEGVKP